MEISDAQIQRFIGLYKKDSGKTLTREEAYPKALSLIQFLTLAIIPFEISPDGDRIKEPDSRN